ncbi:MAG TPA: LytTR family DNA-binding domain-containing protein [Lachnospiraceae bacterium]|nr:LytTR family DNA-binding domain-containing protein [Lachnospiraceae bacterium]
MNIHINMIEDETTFAEDLKTKILAWSDQNNHHVFLMHYTSGKEFFSSAQIETDAFFLDISLDGENGIEIARHLRDLHYNGVIIFLTSHHEYVFEGYEVRALDFLIKPIVVEKLYRCLDRISQNLADQNYILRTKKEIYKIPYNEILYISSSNHSIEIVTDKESFHQAIGMKEVLKHLPSSFQQCHRTLIINIEKAICISNHDITMINHTRLPIGKKYLMAIQDAFYRRLL